MYSYLGVVFALIALFGWGFGDFFTQKLTRKIGGWQTLFFIGTAGAILFLPFVINDQAKLAVDNWSLLAILGALVIINAPLGLEALRRGKISVVEPVFGLELPLTVIFSIILARERLMNYEAVLIILIFLGILLVVTANLKGWRTKIFFEAGVLLAGLNVAGLALNNVLIGLSSQQISPITTVWFMHVVIAAASALVIIFQGNFRTVAVNFKKNLWLICSLGLINNIAWLAYAYATIYVKISIAATISESYIILATLLGIFINREKLKPHQIIGIIVAILGVLILSALTSK
ncbi:MAG: EamA family transporter [Patescibacteria group bacterium]